VLSEKIKDYQVQAISIGKLDLYGDKHDGVIAFAGKVEGGLIEVSYFYGDAKPEKNIIVISTQVGCPSKCSFCELGVDDKKDVRNLTAQEMYEQAVLMLQQAQQNGVDIDAIDHKITFANSGDSLFNPQTVGGLEKLAEFNFSYKVSTIFPSGKKARDIFEKITSFAAEYTPHVQIQVSLISTSEEYRSRSAGIKVASFDEIASAARYWRDHNPSGRKINLSLILTGDNPVDANDVCQKFPPELFRFRFRNYVPTQNGRRKGLKIITNENFDAVLDAFKEKGYEVGLWATPTPIEQQYGLVANVPLQRYKAMIAGKV